MGMQGGERIRRIEYAQFRFGVQGGIVRQDFGIGDTHKHGEGEFTMLALASGSLKIVSSPSHHHRCVHRYVQKVGTLGEQLKLGLVVDNDGHIGIPMLGRVVEEFIVVRPVSHVKALESVEGAQVGLHLPLPALHGSADANEHAWSFVHGA